MKTQLLVRTALLAALTAVLSQLSIPLPGLIPINLAMLAVFLSGALLGAKWGAISQIVYLLIGLVGVPVFSGFRGGPGVLAGPTGGYLIGYIAAALLIGTLVSVKPSFWMLPLSMVLGLIACYAFGTAWYVVSTASSFRAALAICVIPFLIGDAVKIVAASLAVSRIGILRMTRVKAIS